MMESEERPAKLRKLSRGSQDTKPFGIASFGLAGPEEGASEIEQVEASSESSHDEDAADSTGPRASNGTHDTSSRIGGNGTTTASQPDGQTLSKNQMKKLQKKAEWEAGREFRKAKRKERIQEKRAKKRAAKEASQAHTTEKQEAVGNAPRPPARSWIRLPISIILDCSFDSLMFEKERISLGSQLTRCYSDNYRAPFQVHMIVSSWGGQLKQRFDTILEKHHENWKGVIFTEEDFVATIEMAKEAMRGPMGGRMAGAFAQYAQDEDRISNGLLDFNGDAIEIREENAAPTQPAIDTKNDAVASETKPEPTENSKNDADADTTVPVQNNAMPKIEQGEVIYLTSDSPNTLEELKPYSTYIVGGLVDKNREKGICYKTACDRGIKTAKLPIGEFMEMQSRFVLATNHVMEIMIRWLECGDWGKAFMQVIPKRKGGKLKGSRGVEARAPSDDQDQGELSSHSSNKALPTDTVAG